MAAPLAKTTVSVDESDSIPTENIADANRLLMLSGAAERENESGSLNATRALRRDHSGTQSPATSLEYGGEVLGASDTSRLKRGKPENIAYRGVSLSVACATGDLPLIAMLLAEGADQGVDMLVGDEVSELEVA